MADKSSQSDVGVETTNGLILVNHQACFQIQLNHRW